MAAREKIAGRMLLLDETLAEALPLMFDFLGVPGPRAAELRHIDPEARQRRLFDLIAETLDARAEPREPAVSLIEDLHWIDRGERSVPRELSSRALPGTGRSCS